MAFTPESNRLLAERLKREKGVDANGKSLHHQRAGALGGKVAPGHFKKMAETDEGRAQLREVSRRGAAASNAKRQGGAR